MRHMPDPLEQMKGDCSWQALRMTSRHHEILTSEHELDRQDQALEEVSHADALGAVREQGRGDALLPVCESVCLALLKDGRGEPGREGGALVHEKLEPGCQGGFAACPDEAVKERAIDVRAESGRGDQEERAAIEAPARGEHRGDGSAERMADRVEALDTERRQRVLDEAHEALEGSRSVELRLAMPGKVEREDRRRDLQGRDQGSPACNVGAEAVDEHGGNPFA